jgi:hypothetical protein
MDAIWHAAILDTRFYAELQEELGCVLHHRPAGGSDEEAEARRMRLTSMEALYGVYFSAKPLGPVASRPAQPNGPLRSPPVHDSMTQEAVPTSLPKATPGFINIKVRGDYDTIFFKIKKSTCLSKVIRAVQERKGHSIRILSGGERIWPTDTPESLGLEDGDDLEYHRELCGC